MLVHASPSKDQAMQRHHPVGIMEYYGVGVGMNARSNRNVEYSANMGLHRSGPKGTGHNVAWSNIESCKVPAISDGVYRRCKHIIPTKGTTPPSRATSGCSHPTTKLSKHGKEEATGRTCQKWIKERDQASWQKADHQCLC